MLISHYTISVFKILVLKSKKPNLCLEKNDIVCPVKSVRLVLGDTASTFLSIITDLIAGG